MERERTKKSKIRELKLDETTTELVSNNNSSTADDKEEAKEEKLRNELHSS